MARHASAEKRHRQNAKRRSRNVSVRGTFREATKAARAEAHKKDHAKVKETTASAVRAVEKAKSKGVLHWKTAARMVARLARARQRAS